MSTLATENHTLLDQGQETGPWDSSLEKLREWDPAWTEQCLKTTTNPWTNGILSRKTIELICIAVNAACTNLNLDGTRRHIRAALETGASRQEILTVLKMASLLGIHSCTVGAPILLEEAEKARIDPAPRSRDPGPTPVANKLREVGQWNAAWDEFFDLDPAWTEGFMAMGIPGYSGGVIPPKLAEFLSIALDASYTHMYAPETRRHIKAALKLGATVEEIMEVLKLCVIQGVQAFNQGVPILDEELERFRQKR